MTSSVSVGPQYTFVTALGVQFQAIILYRILRGLPDIADEFDSYAKMGHVPRRPLVGAAIADWGATSLFDSLVDARNVAHNMRTAGRPVTEIAEVHLPTNGWFPLRQTGKNRHHWSGWGDTEHMAVFIVARHPVEEVEHA